MNQSSATKMGLMNQGNIAGVCMHITSLPGRYGVGDIGASAHRFIDQMVTMGLRVWQFLPTGPTAYGDSPYQPLSAFANNELLIGVDDLIAQQLLEYEEVEGLLQLALDFVDYGSLIPLKQKLIELAADRFVLKANESSKERYAEYLDANDYAWLHDYAVFRVLKSGHDQQPWWQWPTQFALRDEAALTDFIQSNQTAIERVKIAQFLFAQQWQALRKYAREKGILLFGDMPIYIALDSADAWSNPQMLRFADAGVPSHVAGVPPDYFSADGQLWGNPLYDWDYHSRTDYRWWIRRMAYSMSIADTTKIDHFRGFESYWAVPFGAKTAREGVWDQGPGDDLFNAIYQSLEGVDIVAENLGVITEAVECLRKRHRIPGMHVLHFDICDANFNIRDVDPDSVMYTGTHDNDTTVGWFQGAGADTRTMKEIEQTQQCALKATGGSTENIHIDMIRLALGGPSKVVIIPLQDFLGLDSTARFNRPGTTNNNWRWRATKVQLSNEFCASVLQMIDQAGRAPSS